MSAYTYKRLQGNDKIRLLRIVTVPKQDKGLAKANGLNLDIETYALDAAPPYECVSYAWVTNERDLHVELFDGTSVSITASLLTALPYLMSACETNHLWIDQLCINQDDLNERSAQVSIMGQIYRGARRLLVWLCQESEDTARFLHLARRYDHEYAIVEDLEICAELGGVGSYIPKADQSFDWYFAIRARGPCPFHTIKDWNLGAETMQVAIELATPYRRSIQSVFNLPWVRTLSRYRIPDAELESVVQQGMGASRSACSKRHDDVIRRTASTLRCLRLGVRFIQPLHSCASWHGLDSLELS